MDVGNLDGVCLHELALGVLEVKVECVTTTAFKPPEQVKADEIRYVGLVDGELPYGPFFLAGSIRPPLQRVVFLMQRIPQRFCGNGVGLYCLRFADTIPVIINDG